jgi:hypothetical protein
MLEQVSENFHICWIINICTWVESFNLNVLNPLFINFILHSPQYFEMDIYNN